MDQEKLTAAEIDIVCCVEGLALLCEGLNATAFPNTKESLLRRGDRTLNACELWVNDHYSAVAGALLLTEGITNILARSFYHGELSLRKENRT